MRQQLTTLDQPTCINTAFGHLDDSISFEGYISSPSLLPILITTMSELVFPTTFASQIQPYLPGSSNDDPTTTTTTTPTLPFVTLTFATSLDSALSLAPGVQTHLSGPLSKAMTHHLRSHHSAILVGVGTAIADDPGLNCRIDGVGGLLERQPVPLVLDPTARWDVSSESRVVRTAREGKGKAPFVLVASSVWERLLSQNDARIQGRIDVLESLGGGYMPITTDATTGRFEWTTILSTIRQTLGLDSVMIEGGGTVINSLLEDDQSRALIDAVIVTIAPTWLGKGGVVVSPERRAGSNHEPLRLKNLTWVPMGEDVVLCGRL